MADIWVPLRAGSDIVFLGALIHYVLENGKEFRDYVVPYTNASTILREDFRDTEDLDGLFSGWDRRKSKYDPESWLYAGTPEKSWRSSAGHAEAGGGHGKDRGGEARRLGRIRVRSDVAASAMCISSFEAALCALHAGDGRACLRSSQEIFLKVAEIFTPHRGRRKRQRSATRWDGLSIRKACRSFAPRPFFNCCSATSDAPAAEFWHCAGTLPSRVRPTFLLFTTFSPAICPMPFFGEDSHKLDDYIKKHKPVPGLWSSFDKYFISLMKAYYGDKPPRKTTGDSIGCRA